MAVTVAEKALIAQVRHLARKANNPAIRTGIGDDCAVLRTPLTRSKGQSGNPDVLITTDFSLENVHFRRNLHPPESIGHRCLTRGLSDIAAMGGKPLAAFLSLALPRNVPQSWINRFTEGLLALAKRYGVALAGGDTAESPNGILADIVVIGTVAKGKAILRSGAKPRDRIYVTGELGGSAAAIEQMRKTPKTKLKSGEYSQHFFPQPRLEIGRALREKGLASAMIDISDGLSTDLAHICDESRVGATVSVDRIPRAVVGRARRQVNLDLALHGGEDYELLFTASGKMRIPSRIGGIAITQIGQIIPGRKMFLQDGGVRRELKPQGWEHFRK